MTEKSKKERRTNIKPLSLMSKFHIEARRSVHGMSLVIGGIIGISDFSSDMVILKGHSGKVTVVGNHLCISIYEGGTVEILGKVEDINFRYGKN